jgi:hypothetical protein
MAKRKSTESEAASAPAPKKRAPAAKKIAKSADSPLTRESSALSSLGSIASLAEAVDTPRVPDSEQIAQRAYLLWIERGCPEGSPAEDWYRAERELYGKMMAAAV